MCRVRLLLCATIFACLFTVLDARADVIPADGLILWLDASDIDADGVRENNPKMGAGIARWTDKSSQNNHVEQTANDRQPTFQRGALGGVPVVRFHGKDVLQRRPIRGLQPGDRPFYAVFMMKARMVNPQTNPRLLDLRSDNGDTKKLSHTVSHRMIGDNTEAESVQLNIYSTVARQIRFFLGLQTFNRQHIEMLIKISRNT